MRSRFSLSLALSSSVVAAAAIKSDEQQQQQQQQQQIHPTDTNHSNNKHEPSSSLVVSDSTISHAAKNYEATSNYHHSFVGSDHPNNRISNTRTLRNFVSPETVKSLDETNSFDPSKELGILNKENPMLPNENNDSIVPFRGLLEDAANNNATITNATTTHTTTTTTTTTVEDFDCGSNRPLVGKNIPFSRLIHTCLSTPEDCPYDAEHLECWNTSLVEDMSYAFYGMSSFDQPIGGWETSSVTDMRSMLRGASCFNQHIGGWETSSVQDTRYMFLEARQFDQPVEQWDTSAVTSMSGMFRSAYRFNKPVGEWDVSSVQTTREMFFGAVDFDQVLEGWRTSAITDTKRMFNVAVSFNQPIDSWDVSSMTDTEAMFDTALAFNQCLSSWDLPAAAATISRATRTVSTANMFAFSGCPSANNWCDGASSPLYPERCDENFVPISEDPWCQGSRLGCGIDSSDSSNIREFATSSANPTTGLPPFPSFSGGNSLSPSRWYRNTLNHRSGISDVVSNGLIMAFVFGVMIPTILF